MERVPADTIRGIGDDEVNRAVRDIPGRSADTVAVVKRTRRERDTPYTRPALFQDCTSMNCYVARLHNKWQKD